jgi:release factor glutamine methyltransferase
LKINSNFLFKDFKYLVNSISAIFSQKEAESIAYILFEDLFRIKRTEIFTNNSSELNAGQKSEIESAIKRLLNHEPVQYITCRTRFADLEIVVNPDVLIPRPETEELVYLILSKIKVDDPVILDIGTGSGCIAIALADKLPDSKITGVDISEKSIHVARHNAEMNHTIIEFYCTDILDRNNWRNLSGDYDIIVSNPPYIPIAEKDSLDLNVSRFEPSVALFVPDALPLQFYDAICDLGSRYLKTGGSVYFEIHEKYGKEMTNLLRIKGYRDVEIISDVNGKDRIAHAIK